MTTICIGGMNFVCRSDAQYVVTSWISQTKDPICARKWLDLMVEELNTMDWQVTL